MTRYIIFKKSFALIFLFIYLNFLFFSTPVLALSINGIQPEQNVYSSGSNPSMVNLYTGDMGFDIPLIYVPGSEGGFSMPLHYSAGISPEQEASWVGLGWSLNPGAINRNVIQHPDDFNGEVVTNSYYMSDKSSTLNSVFIPLLIWNLQYVNQTTYSGDHLGGLILTDFLGNKVGTGDYQGNSVLGIVNWKAGQDPKVDPWGIPNLVINVAVLIASIKAGGAPSTAMAAQKALSTILNSLYQIAVTIQTLSVNTRGGQSSSDKGVYVQNNTDINCPVNIGYYNNCQSVVSVDYTEKAKAYGSIYTGNEPRRGNRDILAYKLKNSNFTLAEYYYFTNIKYKINNNEYYQSYKFAPSDQDEINDINHISTDVYQNLESEIYAEVLAPSALAKDQFYVQGENLQGKIEPYRMESGILGTYRRMANSTSHASGKYLNNYKPQFRYSGLPTNFYNYSQIRKADGTIDNLSSGLHYDKHLNYVDPTTGTKTYIDSYITIDDPQLFDIANGHNYKLDPDRSSANEFYKNTEYIKYNNSQPQAWEYEHKLSAGKNISWYTNGEILNFGAQTQIPSYLDLLDYSKHNGDRFDFRRSKPESGIGAFVINREDGYSYHYALPSYNSKMESKAFNIDIPRDQNQIMTTSVNNNLFANSWLLTAITGPDFVDRGQIGVLDDSDWGYWVNFEYGKYSNNYSWRAPYVTNSSKDLNYEGVDFANSYLRTPDNKIDYFTKGERELYYLDAIRTRSHTAIFIKGVRKDGGGVNLENPKNKSLYLKQVYLFDNSTFVSLLRNGLSKTPLNSNSQGLLNNVFDDLDLIPTLKSEMDLKVLKKIEFNYDYSLCKGVLNTSETSTTQNGKLTLNSLSIFTNNNVKIVPDYNFQYDNNPNYGKHNYDGWGMYCSSEENGIQSNGVLGNIHKPIEKENLHNVAVQSHLSSSSQIPSPISNSSLDAAAWSLTKIITPFNAEISFLYERDSYSNIAGNPLNTFYDNVNEKVGGNLRVAKISTIDNVNNDKTNQIFRYVQYGVGNGSSGVCSFEPDYISYDFQKRYKPYNGTSDVDDKYNSYFFYKNIFNYPLMPITYSDVQVYDGATINSVDYNTITNYKFSTLNCTCKQNEVSDACTFEWKSSNNPSDNSYSGSYGKQIDSRINNTYNIIIDKTASVGKLLSRKVYDKIGNLIEQEINTYKNDLSGHSPKTNDNLGKYTESTLNLSSNHLVGKTNYKIQTNINRSLYFDYANVLTKTEITKNGNYTSIDYDGFDNITGQPLIRYSTDSYGNRIKAENIPAYTQYAAMGSKAKNVSNKNMLLQSYADYVYNVNSSNEEEGILSANVYKWSNTATVRELGTSVNTTQSTIWRANSNYIWIGDKYNNDNVNLNGSFSLSSFNTDKGNLTTSLKWQKISEYALFDNYSHPLEVINSNGQSITTLYEPKGRFAILNVSNSQYNEVAYSGAEGLIAASTEGNVTNQGGNIVDFPTTVHTGKYALALDPGEEGFRFTMKANKFTANRKYRASVWVYFPGIAESNLDKTELYYSQGSTIGKSNAKASKKAGSWYLIETYFTPTSNATDVVFGIKNTSDQVRTVYADDFRVAPANASVKCMVVDSDDFSVNAELDNDHLYIRYEYDPAGRVKNTFAERIGKPVEQRLGSNVYNYVK